MTTDAPSIVWFRQDLRLADNPALARALERPGPLVPLFILDEGETAARRPGAAQRWWLHHSLAALDEALKDRGSRLILRRGAASEVLAGVAAETGAKALYWNRCYDPASVARDRAVKSWAKEEGLEVESFNGLLLMEPWEIATKEGKSYRVFSPFWRRLRECYDHRAPLPAPDALPAAPDIAGDGLADWALLPEKPNWAEGFAALWEPGEAGARARLADFLEDSLAGYKAERDRPDRRSTSRLSPHLRFGEISPRQVWQAVEDHLSVASGGQSGADKFLSEIGWREFSYHLLFHEENLAEAPLRSNFAGFPWRESESDLRRWQRGRTGYPIVDAGMRELWATGWMHNRVRMIVASFLIKDLLISWQEGEAWFWDTLVDGDPANNSASWQWVAGCGADAAPFFRIFNPVSQGERFDPKGAYVRTWLPELEGLPDKVIHRPWEADEETLAEAGVNLGETYPRPIVDHAQARKAALQAFEEIKKEKAA